MYLSNRLDLRRSKVIAFIHPYFYSTVIYWALYLQGRGISKSNKTWFCLQGDLCLVAEREMYIKIIIPCDKCNNKSRNWPSANLYLTAKDLFVVFCPFKCMSH